MQSFTNTYLHSRSFYYYQNNNEKNFITFSNYIRNVLIEADKMMVSLDVTSFHIFLLQDHLINGKFIRKMAVPQNKFLDLDHMVLTTTLYTFNFKFHPQTDDAAMGNNKRNINAD